MLTLIQIHVMSKVFAKNRKSHVFLVICGLFVILVLFVLFFFFVFFIFLFLSVPLGLGHRDFFSNSPPVTSRQINNVVFFLKKERKTHSTHCAHEGRGKHNSPKHTNFNCGARSRWNSLRTSGTSCQDAVAVISDSTGTSFPW